MCFVIVDISLMEKYICEQSALKRGLIFFFQNKHYQTFLHIIRMYDVSILTKRCYIFAGTMLALCYVNIFQKKVD